MTSSEQTRNLNRLIECHQTCQSHPNGAIICVSPFG